jgi:ribosome biogenesis GTPase
MLLIVPNDLTSYANLEPGSPGVALDALGWSDRWEALFASLAESGLEAGRVTRVDRGMPVVAARSGVFRAEPATHLVKTRGEAESRAVVGDWIALSHPQGHDLAIIEAILPRSSSFVRKDPGEEIGEQVLTANVDVVFVVQSLSGRGVNVRRLERELVLAWESGAQPVVVLSKADLSLDPKAAAEEAAAVALGVDVVVESAITHVGLDELLELAGPGTTIALLGGSGVGKSTLVNRMLGIDLLDTVEVRAADDKGRHCTVAREMVMLPSGGVVIDTPGMRALALWDAPDGIAAAFADVLAFAVHCKFRDCSHTSEPGCAVLAAVESGELPQRRLDSYRDLMSELDVLSARQDQRAWAERDRAGRVISKAAKQFYRDEPKRKGQG